jgi:hypothetical protein
MTGDTYRPNENRLAASDADPSTRIREPETEGASEHPMDAATERAWFASMDLPGMDGGEEDD